MKKRNQVTRRKENEDRYGTRNKSAAALALLILIAGTFAWQAFDQEAVNEFRGESPSPGARLHDDYNGSNKDVYIENYLTIDEGGDDIYVRIRIDEYLEYGTGAGVMYEEDMERGEDIKVVRGDYQRNEEIIPDIFDEDTWDTYIPQAYRTETQEESIRDYRNLEFGSRKYYLPTFNKNYGSEEADINGTMEGQDGERLSEDQYTDYVAYSSGYNTRQDEIYAYPEGSDLPEGAIDNEDGTYRIENVLHTATLTGGAKERPSAVSSYVITMDQWLDLSYEDKKGNYWVYDSNGWAYWAAPLEPQTATDVLLDEVKEVRAIPGAAWYYSINVVTEMATAGDWGNKESTVPDDQGMYAEITTNGLALLNHISNQVGVDIQLTDGYYNSFVNNISALALNQQLDIKYSLEIIDGLDVAEEKEVNWTVTYQSGSGGNRDASACLNTEKSQTDNLVSFTPNSADMVGNTYRIMVSSVVNPDMFAYVDVTVYDASTMSLEDVEFELLYSVDK